MSVEVVGCAGFSFPVNVQPCCSVACHRKDGESPGVGGCLVLCPGLSVLLHRFCASVVWCINIQYSCVQACAVYHPDSIDPSSFLTVYLSPAIFLALKSLDLHRISHYSPPVSAFQV